MPRTPRKPILVVIRDNDKINYHPFGMVNIHEIVLPDTRTRSGRWTGQSLN